MVLDMGSVNQSNVELMRETYEAFNERDLESVLEVFDEDLEWVEPEGWPYGGTYHGPDEVVEDVFKPALSDNEDFEVALDRVIDSGETVVVVGAYRGTVAETGNSFDLPFAHVYDMKDGHVTRAQIYTDTAQYQQVAKA